MDKGLFTSSAITALLDLVRAIGYLEALTGAFFALALGVAYTALRRTWSTTGGSRGGICRRSGPVSCSAPPSS